MSLANTNYQRSSYLLSKDQNLVDYKYRDKFSLADIEIALGFIPHSIFIPSIFIQVRLTIVAEL